MKSVNSDNSKYLVNNIPTGKQTIKLYEPSNPNSTGQVGTTVVELLKVCNHKLNSKLADLQLTLELGTHLTKEDIKYMNTSLNEIINKLENK